MDKKLKTRIKGAIAADINYVNGVIYTLHDSIASDAANVNRPVGIQADKVVRELKILREKLTQDAENL